MPEDHAADFIESSSPDHGVYGEHGAESIDKIFRFLQRATSHDTSAEFAKKEHYRLVHPDRSKGSETCNSLEKVTSKGRKLSVTIKIFVYKSL